MATHSSILAQEIPWTEEPEETQETIFQVGRQLEAQTDYKLRMCRLQIKDVQRLKEETFSIYWRVRWAFRIRDGPQTQNVFEYHTHILFPFKTVILTDFFPHYQLLSPFLQHYIHTVIL